MSSILPGREAAIAYADRWSMPRIAVRATRPTAFPPCALCGCHVSDCACDPDEAMGAALIAMQNREGGRA